MNDEPTLAPGVEALIGRLRGKTLDDLILGSVEEPTTDPAPVPGVESRDLTIEPGRVPGSAPVGVRRYEPAVGTDAARPGVVWVHGGAWMFGDLDEPEADAVARRLCRQLDAVVYSVDYRLAPAHTFPAAFDDVYAVVEATMADPAVDSRRVVLGGASAGGNLAAGVAQAWRDRDDRPLAAVFLAYPATNPIAGPYPDVRPDVCPELLWFTESLTAGLFSMYLGGADDQTYAVPAAGTLAGLAPTLVTTSAIDALEAQAIAYADALRDAGVAVEHHRVPDLLHGYLSMVGTVAAADDALAAHADWLAGWLAGWLDPREEET